MKKTTSILSILLALIMVFSVTSAAAEALSLTAATAGSVDLLAEGTHEIAASDTITLTFSNNVTDTTVLANNTGKISVKNSEGSKIDSISVAVGADNKTLDVSLGEIAKGSYTLTVGKGIKAKNGTELTDKTEISFSVTKGSGSGSGNGSGGGNNPLSFVSAKVNDTDLKGAELEGTETIAIAFDRGMKTYESDNANLIGVYKADGTKADFTVLAVDDSQDATKRIVNVKLNGLEGGEYTLKIGADVKANNGNTLGEDVTVSFTVKAAEKSLLDTIIEYVKIAIEFIRNIITYVVSVFKTAQ